MISEQAIKEGRLKILCFPMSFLLDLFNMGEDRFYYTVRWKEQLPENAVVLSAHPNYATNSIELMVCSEEFPPTIPGQALMRIVGNPYLEKIEETSCPEDLALEDQDEI